MQPLSMPMKAVVCLACVNAAAYLILPLTEGSIPFVALKTSCCVLLAVFVHLSMQLSPIKKLLIAALLLSALGDLFLAIRSTDYFIQGLGSFLIAHLLYISIFVKLRAASPAGSMKSSLIGLIFIISILMIVLLWPYLGALKPPVVIYIAVISLMAIAAIRSRLNATLVVSGAFLFLVSDATIAVNKFLEPFSFANAFIWITYFTAQIVLTFAISQGLDIKKAQTSQPVLP